MPDWYDLARSTADWQAANADYVSDHHGRSAMDKLLLRLTAVERMKKFELHFEGIQQ